MSLYLNPDVSLIRRLGRWIWRSLQILGLMAILLAIIYLIIHFLLSPRDKRQPSTKTSSYEISNGLADFTTDYFKFSAPKAWQFLANNSNDKKYVYVHYFEGIVDEQFEVYIGSPPLDNSTAYVAKVLVTDEHVLQAQSFSKQCQAYVADKSNRNQQTVIFERTAFLCRPDSSVADVAIGSEADGTALRLRHGAGTAVYYLYFRDSRFTPQIEDITELLDTFQAR